MTRQNAVNGQHLWHAPASGALLLAAAATIRGSEIQARPFGQVKPSRAEKQPSGPDSHAIMVEMSMA